MDWLPTLGLTNGLGAYAAVAISMVAVEVFLLVEVLPRSGSPPPVSRMVIGCTALLGSAALLLALLDYLFFPGSVVAATGLLWGLNFMMFVPPGLWVVGVIVFRDRKVDPAGWGWPALIAASVTGSEVLMGLIFSVSTPAPRIDLATAAQSLVSPWFDWSMAAAMATLLVWVPLDPEERWLLGSLTATAVVSPWVGASALLGAALVSGTMAFGLMVAYRALTAPRDEERPVNPRLPLGVSAGFVVMTGAGWADLALGGANGLLAFGLLTLFVMTAETAYLARRALLRLRTTPDPPAALAAEARPAAGPIASDPSRFAGSDRRSLTDLAYRPPSPVADPGSFDDL